MECENCKSLKSKVLRLLAYLSSVFIDMCPECCYTKKTCQCKKE